MKFIISRNELNKMIGRIQNVISPKSTIPILANVLIEATDSEIVFTATDLTVGMKCYTEAKVLEKGAITLPARRFFQLVRELTCENLEIATHPEHPKAIITAGSSVFHLNGMEESEFPALPSLSGAKQIKMDQQSLKENLFQTSFAISRDDNRYVLMGMLLQIEDKKAIFVGTDGKRLAKSQREVNTDADFTGQFVIPLKAIEEMQKNLESNDEELATIHLLEDKVALETNRTLIVTKLLSGAYPDFNQVIPATSEISVSLHVEELSTLLRQIILFTADTNSSVRFTFQEGQLTLLANSLEIGQGKVSMPVDYHGEQVDIAFNPNYFLDILKHTKDEAVKLGLSDAFNPGVIEDTTEAMFILMPMRLTEEKPALAGV
ncbi:MAG: DNA polymerase III subunit beta [Chlamydiales bacterium]|nr:DNA polymerase III subunit beta [Chlamydiales bacterium]NCF70600.1 DNA polymerase III subunit beta [Chlamydiales bacterium]